MVRKPAGHAFGETAEMTEHLVAYTVPKADVSPGRYRTVSGTEGLAWGLVAGLRAAGIEKLVFAGYPITPASALLHTLANLRAYGVFTFQAEDEIAAAGAALGASYAGALGVTSSSGPGIALKTEMLGLAIATELPLIVIDSQRAGPSTGMPTKAEQSDLFQAVLGRNADAPLAVLAPVSTADCFDIAMEAVRLATKYMTPVMVLSDGYLAHAAEPWRIPSEADLPRFPVSYRTDPEGFHPFLRDPETLARPWVKPGTPQLEHRIGGLENRRVDRLQPGARRPDDRQQRIEDERRHRRPRANAAHERQWEQESEQRQAGNGLDDVGEGGTWPADTRLPRGEDAKRHARRNGHER